MSRGAEREVEDRGKTEGKAAAAVFLLLPTFEDFQNGKVRKAHLRKILSPLPPTSNMRSWELNFKFPLLLSPLSLFLLIQPVCEETERSDGGEKP